MPKIRRCGICKKPAKRRYCDGCRAKGRAASIAKGAAASIDRYKRGEWGSIPELACGKCLAVLGFGIKVITKRIGVGHGTAARLLKAVGRNSNASDPNRRLVHSPRAQIYQEPYELKVKREENKLRKQEEQFEKRLSKRISKVISETVEFYATGLTHRERLRKRWAETERIRYATNPQHMLRMRLRRRLRKVVFDASPGMVRSCKEFIGCSLSELVAHIESQFSRGMTWQNFGKWHIDHIIPCSSFDLTKEEEVRKCFHYWNLQPLWARENIAKGAKIIPTQMRLAV